MKDIIQSTSIEFLKPPEKMLETILPSSVPVKKPSKKLRSITGMVRKAKQETQDTYTLYIQVDKRDRDYLAGQFINISPKQFPELKNMVDYLESLKEKSEPVRAYSMASIPTDNYVMITVKPEPYEPGETDYPPLLSPLLASDILVGREIEFHGYTGAYTLKEDYAFTCKEVLHIVAGSGAVPNYALIRDELENEKNPEVVHTLVDINKTYDDIIYAAELERLARKYPKRFKLFHFITREENPEKYGPHFTRGRPTKADYKDLVSDWSTVLVFSCGAGITKWQRKKAKSENREPQKRFLEHVQETVTELGVDKKRFKKEAYG